MCVCVCVCVYNAHVAAGGGRRASDVAAASSSSASRENGGSTNKSSFTVGVVIPCGGNIDVSEVWVCSQTGSCFQVLDVRRQCVSKVLVVPQSRRHNHAVESQSTTSSGAGGSAAGSSSSVKHIATYCLEGGVNMLAVAFSHLLQMWDVKKRSKVDEIDCHQYCEPTYGDCCEWSGLLW